MIGPLVAIFILLVGTTVIYVVRTRQLKAESRPSKYEVPRTVTSFLDRRI